MDNGPLIRLTGITKQFPGVLALDRVDLDVRRGEIHAVLGENGAGKSTLMNVLAGEIQPDSGRIVFEDQPVTIGSPLVSQRLGISVVYQELALCGNLTIAENIAMNSISRQGPFSFVRRGRFAAHAGEVLAKLGLYNIDPNQTVGRLTVAQQQMVEIAKAISQQCKLLILDEPNSALTFEETEHLFRVLRQLCEDGVAIIYVSHRLEEVLQIADRISVMRDGRYIGTQDNDGTITIESLITQMVGRSVDHFFNRGKVHQIRDDNAVEIEGFTSGTAFRDISLSVRRGEIVGIAGLPDSGKDELVDSLFGLLPHTGTIKIAGAPAKITTPAQAIKYGFALVPADRRGTGALLQMSVEHNVVAASLKSVSSMGIVQGAKTRAAARDVVDDFDVRISGLRQKMRTLSGGNQQKVIIGRGLATQPSILLLHEPTRGIDVGAKAEIYTILGDLAQDGMSILLVSSELPELISQCDRIFVMHRGRLTGQFLRDSVSEEAILACAMGQKEHLDPYTASDMESSA